MKGGHGHLGVREAGPGRQYTPCDLKNKRLQVGGAAYSEQSPRPEVLLLVGETRCWSGGGRALCAFKWNAELGRGEAPEPGGRCGFGLVGQPGRCCGRSL